MQTENLNTPRTPQGDAPSTLARTPNEPAKPNPNSRPWVWVVLEDPPSGDRTFWSEHRSMLGAIRECTRANARHGMSLIVMKRTEDGALTTEF